MSAAKKISRIADHSWFAGVVTTLGCPAEHRNEPANQPCSSPGLSTLASVE